MILLTGSTGFIGAHVLKSLCRHNIPVRCLSRNPQTSADPNITYVTGDVLDQDSLVRVSAGIDTVYYFIHMMGKQKHQQKFDILDRLAVNNMVRACRINGVRRIIHLTGIRNPNEKLSQHLASRKEVEDIIKESGIEYTIFRASVIIGRGGGAFEVLDTAVRKFPVIPVLDWEKTQIQPIYIDDVIHYLVGCLDKKETMNKCYDIGCPDVLTYRELMEQYAQMIGLKRSFVKVPGSWRWISGRILGQLTPIDPNVVFWLIESLHNNMVCEPNDLEKIFGFKPISFRESVKRLVREYS